MGDELGNAVSIPVENKKLLVFAFHRFDSNFQVVFGQKVWPKKLGQCDLKDESGRDCEAALMKNVANQNRLEKVRTIESMSCCTVQLVLVLRC